MLQIADSDIIPYWMVLILRNNECPGRSVCGIHLYEQGVADFQEILEKPICFSWRKPGRECKNSQAKSAGLQTEP